MPPIAVVNQSVWARNTDQSKLKMNKLCRQVSIESPGPQSANCVFNFVVPIPDTPPHGVRIRVVCAGACYRRQRSPSISSISSVSSDLNEFGSIDVPAAVQQQQQSTSPAHHGVRDGALFPGFEVAGIIEELGSNVESNDDIHVGKRVVLYPFDDAPSGYAEFIVVPELKYIVPIPDQLPISVAAMLPTGALLAMNTVFNAYEHVDRVLNNRKPSDKCKILIVGTGGLALWAVRIAEYYHSINLINRVQIVVASLKDEGFVLAKEIGNNLTVVQWNDDLYEKQLIERTIDACGGNVDIVIDFGTTSRSLHRSLLTLGKGGIVLVSEEVGEKLLPKFSKLAHEREQKIIAIPNGTIEQLIDLVHLVSTGAIQPPPHSEFPCDQAAEVVKKLCASEITGRAILRFHDIE